MTGRIIPLRDDRHYQVQSLLPWYLTGRLDPSEKTVVEAHLADCPECQAELRAERRLEHEVAAAPFSETSADADHGWALMRGLIAQGSPRPGPLAALRAGLGEVGRGWRASPPWLRWAAAGQLALILALVVFPPPAARQVHYRTLGAAPSANSANLVVVFRPDVTEGSLRRLLKDNHARLVDGPTSTDAYLVRVPPAERAGVIDNLRRQAAIELAEPVDSGSAP